MCIAQVIPAMLFSVITSHVFHYSLFNTMVTVITLTTEMNNMRNVQVLNISGSGFYHAISY
jgi:hypothetical protein